MNILHISDLHFGTRHWDGNNEMLLEKLNSYAADIVINTGDITTDGLESEFETASIFLNSISCDNVISIMGNHDKRNLRSQDLYREWIDDGDIIYPLNPEKCTKKYIYLDQRTAKVNDIFTDINFIKEIKVDGESIMIVGIDSNEMYSDNGYIDEEILHAVSEQIEQKTYDKIILLNHHSILETDNDPLYHSYRFLNFILKHKIEHVFCGHTHKLALKKSFDIYHQHAFTQYVSGSLSSSNHDYDTNMFLYYENWGEKEMVIHLVRVFVEKDQLIFKEELIPYENF